MLGLIILSILGVLALIIGFLLVVFSIPLFFMIIPGLIIGVITFAVSSIYWVARVIVFTITGLASTLIQILQGIF
ncbi:MAG: hypothetical protein JSV76_00940 [Candidatus Bathyarchaeota archaeon]|nr:MAG: hypothetical protein JSV76_00940 [Candidatus Bathyarchaeota archaeon]